MPYWFLERFPRPSLQTYTALSAALLAGTVLTVCSSESRSQSSPEETHSHPVHSSRISRYIRDGGLYLGAGYRDVVADVLLYLLTDRVFAWVMLNTACCVLLLIAKLIQCVVFGPLRVSEKQHLKEQFWNFFLYKFIFVFNNLNFQTVENLVIWWLWFFVLVFLHLLVQLCKDRFEYLSLSPITTLSSHARVLLLLVVLLLCCGGLATLCNQLFHGQGSHNTAFMAAECILVTVRTTHVMFRYSIHLWVVKQEGSWDNKSSYIYYANLLMELLLLDLDLLHHIHMLFFSTICPLSVTSLVIATQLITLAEEVKKRTRRHHNYLRVLRNMETRFSVASADELTASNVGCAICWDVMSSARKLPCGHLFHSSCLRSWLEQDTSCPTCRMSLNIGEGGDGHVEREAREAAANPRVDARPLLTQLNHFFQFVGSRIASWLPSFSGEIMATTNFLVVARHMNSSQVQLILLEVTTDNILGGLIQIAALPLPLVTEVTPPPVDEGGASSESEQEDEDETEDDEEKDDVEEVNEVVEKQTGRRCGEVGGSVIYVSGAASMQGLCDPDHQVRHRKPRLLRQRRFDVRPRDPATRSISGGGRTTSAESGCSFTD